MVKRMLLWGWICLSIFLTHCNFEDLETDKIAGIEVSPNLALRVGQKTITVAELIDEIQTDEIDVVTDDELLIHFVINKSLDVSEVQDVISVMTITNSDELQLPEDVPALPFEQTVPFEKIFEFEFNGSDNERIDSIFFKSGVLQYEMTSEFAASVDYDWTIIKTRTIEDNLDLSRSTFLTYSGSPISDSYSRPLLGLKSIIKREGDLNLFNVDLSGDLIVPAGQSVSKDEKFQFDLTYQDPEFSAIFGLFNQQNIDIDKTEFELGAFDEFSGDGFHFSGVGITLEITNSFGLEVLMGFDAVRGEMADGSFITLTSNIPAQDRLVAAPSNVGEAAITRIVIDDEVSNLSELLSAFPERLSFDVSAQMNPDISSLESNFLTDSSSVSINAIVDIPLQVRLDEFQIDFEIDASGLKDLDGAESLAIQIIATNEIPLEGIISMDFVDANGDILLSPEDQLSFLSPSVSASGRVEEPMVTTSQMVLNQEEIDALLSADKIVATVQISTYGADDSVDLKLFSDYELSLELGIVGEVIVEL